jgi:hypothetical protein
VDFHCAGKQEGHNHIIVRNSEKGYRKISTGDCFLTPAAESVVMKISDELNGGNFYAVRYADNIILIGYFIGQLLWEYLDNGVTRHSCLLTQIKYESCLKCFAVLCTLQSNSTEICRDIFCG